MEALGLLKFWRTVAAGADASSDADDVRSSAFVTDEETTDDEDSFFDLDFKSPECGAPKERDGDSKKGFESVESPRGVLRSKNDHFPNSKPLSPVTILRSAPKFKVFMLSFRKSSKCDKAESNGELKASPVNQLSKLSKLDQSNRFSVNCRVADAPAVPVFSRDNSLRSKMTKETFDCDTVSDVAPTEKSVPKYLKLIKPFYAKVSNKVKSTDSVTPSSSPVTAPVNLSPRKFSEGSRIGSFKIVTRNLGKSRSASATATVGIAPPSICRRDESLLEQQNDGIQGAILHCKKSFNSSSQDHSRLFRAASDPSHEKLRNSFEEQKRCSI